MSTSVLPLQKVLFAFIFTNQNLVPDGIPRIEHQAPAKSTKSKKAFDNIQLVSLHRVQAHLEEIGFVLVDVHYIAVDNKYRVNLTFQMADDAKLVGNLIGDDGKPHLSEKTATGLKRLLESTWGFCNGWDNRPDNPVVSLLLAWRKPDKRPQLEVVVRRDNITFVQADNA